MNISEKIENFCLPNDLGQDICIESFLGKWLVIYFYPKDNTSGCTKEAVDFTQNLIEFTQRDTVVIGISPDKPASHISFIKKYDLKHILLCDESKQILKKFGAYGTKKMYGKESEGVIRSTFIVSPTGVIEYKWNNVKVETKSAKGTVKHVDVVLKKLDEIQKQKKY